MQKKYAKSCFFCIFSFFLCPPFTFFSSFFKMIIHI